MPTRTASMHKVIKVEGSELEQDVSDQLESVLVIDRLAMPDMFALVFRDPGRQILDKAGLEIGAKVEVLAARAGDDTAESLIKGEVTSIEAEYDALGTRAVVRGYDKSHRLAAGRKTATFLNVKYSDIVTTIAGDYGLTADVDDSGGTVDHVLQANQSDLEFVYGLARKIGFECRVDDETLLFKEPVESSDAPGAGDYVSDDDPLKLVWNSNLLEFRARMTAVAQVAEVQVRGWDIKEKEAVIGQADVEATNAEISMSASDLAGKFDGKTLTVVDHPAGDQETADETATARAQQVGSAAFEATAVADRPSRRSRPAQAVSVAGVDPALDGKWVITGSRHEFGNGRLPHRARVHRSPGPLDPRPDLAGQRGRRRRHAAVLRGRGRHRDRQQGPRRARPGQGLVPVARRTTRSRHGRASWRPARASSTASCSSRRSATRCSSPSTTATSTSRSSSAACGTARTSSRSTTTRTSTRAP